MNRLTRYGAGLLVVVGVLAGGAGTVPALAAGANFPGFGPPGFGLNNAVFVQTDGLSANQIVAYERAADGTLTQAGIYNTEGKGGQLEGSVVDHTASQGALTYDRAYNLLFAVNPGSNTLSVFSVSGDQLKLRQVIGTGGKFPVSVTASGGYVYVLNAEEGGSIRGYVLFVGRLYPINYRALHLPEASPGSGEQFTHTPGQIAFTPSGDQLIVTTKAAAQSIEVFWAHTLSLVPKVNPEPGAVPFAVAFGREDNLLVAEAGPSALASFAFEDHGNLRQLDALDTEQAATCWVTYAAGYYYTSNAGSATVTGFQLSPGGQLTELENTGTHAGTVDAASVGKFLYVQGGKEGTIDEFEVHSNGSLGSVGSVLVPNAAGGEGIVAG